MVEGTGLENQRWKTSAGSNPVLSARKGTTKITPEGVIFIVRPTSRTAGFSFSASSSRKSKLFLILLLESESCHVPF